MKTIGIILLASALFIVLGSYWFLHEVDGSTQVLGTWLDCFRPLKPVVLDEMFSTAEKIAWNGSEVMVRYEPGAQEDLFRKVNVSSTAPLPRLGEMWAVYDLGPMASGEHLVLEQLANNLGSIWFYDGNYTLIPTADPTELVIRQNTAAVYLVIYLDSVPQAGEPLVRLRREYLCQASAPRPQAVVLNFSGLEGYPAFTGLKLAAIDDPVIKEATIRSFKRAFRNYNLTVLTQDDHIALSSGQISTIWIGMGPSVNSEDFLGLAEDVDPQNQRLDDTAVVNAGDLRLLPLRLLGREVFGRAMGLIAAHEMGHLLGLEHTLEVDDLMSSSRCRGIGLNVPRLLRKRFARAPLVVGDDEVLGTQDAGTYLSQILGPADATGGTAVGKDNPTFTREPCLGTRLGARLAIIVEFPSSDHLHTCHRRYTTRRLHQIGIHLKNTVKCHSLRL